MLKKVDNTIIEDTLQKAKESERKRAIYCIHEKEDYFQRMINAVLYDTYLVPHKHENPDKLEIFLILKGRIAVLIFDDKGEIKEKIILDEKETRLVEIPPRTWHSFVVLTPEAVLYEVIEGKYDEKTHKKFAEWAPKEQDEEAQKYLKKLREKKDGI